MPTKAKAEKKPGKPKAELVFYVGDPGHPETRGQDKHGYVHCLEWVYYKREGRKYTLWWGGSGIGEAKTKAEALKKLHAFAIERLGFRSLRLRDEMRRVQEAMTQLASGPRALGLFAGDYIQR